MDHYLHIMKNCIRPLYEKLKPLKSVECSEKYKSFKLKIPQPDSERRHSPDFRTVFGIMIGPFSSCEIGKTWGTNKQVNKQTNKNWKFEFPQPDLERRHSNQQVLFYTFCCEVLPLLRNLDFLRYIKWEKDLYKMRKTTFQWPKVSRLLTMLPRNRLISEQVSDFRFGHRKCLFWSEEKQ